MTVRATLLRLAVVAYWLTTSRFAPAAETATDGTELPESITDLTTQPGRTGHMRAMVVCVSATELSERLMSYSPTTTASDRRSIELRGVCRSARWTDKNPPHTRTIWQIEANELPGQVVCVIGDVEPGKLAPGVEFRFFGTWQKDYVNQREKGRVEKQFAFTLAIPAEPRGRQAIANYLVRRCIGIGPAVANLIYDVCGEHSVIELRRDPESVAAKVNDLAKRTVLQRDKAVAASEVLKRNINLEETLIELEQLFDGRGFGQPCKDAVIKKWGAMAPLRIRRDPFCLLLAGLSGAGFTRCDKLYCDLGLPTARRRRQMVCLWHAMREDRSGSIWFSDAWATSVLAKAIGGTKPSLERALRFGERIGWLTSVKDAAGLRWIADAKKAENEDVAAERLKALLGWSMPESCGPVTLAELAVAERVGVYQPSDDEYQSLARELSDSSEEFNLRAEIGRRTGICQFCGRVLLHPVSKALGYGPTCAASNGLPWGEDVASAVLIPLPDEEAIRAMEYEHELTHSLA